MPQPSYNPWGTPMFPNTGSAFGVGSPAEAAERQPTFVDSLLSHIAGALGRGFMAPGQALNSTTPITSEQMIAPAQDMSTMMSAGAGAVPAQANELRMGIKAYHGSPHDFDRFDLSKIGTGEGAQAYGHGLYFAENEGVARSYRDALARNNQRPAVTNTNGPFGNVPILEQDPTRPGRMYEVNLNADPAHFLDWDKPLKQQGSVADKIAGVPNDIVQAWTQNGAFPHVKGSSVYDTLAMRGNASGMASGNAGGRAAATEALREAGIPGIRYLDQGSRAGGQGSSNYVMFDDKLIDILRKYGIAGMTAPPIFAGAMSEQKQ